MFELCTIRTAATGLLLTASAALATTPTTLNFTRVEPSNNVEDLGSQLSVLVEPVAGQPNMIDFTFRNAVGIDSSVSEIYFDDGTLLMGPMNPLPQSGATFEFGGASPGDLPGGQNLVPPFDTTMDFLADRGSGNPSNGLDEAGDFVTIRFQLQGGQDCDDVLAALADESLRIGLHVISLGALQGSDSYVNGPATPPNPDINCVIDGPDLVCDDENAVFTVTETAGAPMPEFDWTVTGAGLFDNGMTTTTGTTATVVPNGAPGEIFTVEVTVSSGSLMSTCSYVTTLDDCSDPAKKCIWDQGEWDGIDGQTSENDTAVEESRTADDFCLKEGFVYEIKTISVCMLTNSEEYDATLQLYEDCNGCPGDLVDCGFFDDFIAERLQRNAVGDLDLVKFTFDTSRRVTIDEYGNEEEHPALWLKGGCYWLSPVGQGDGTGYDRSVWATADGDVIGAVPKTQAGPFKIKGWEPVDGLNVECRNFAFELHGECCCILQDNGHPDLDDVAGAVNTTGVGCFNADDFVIPPCTDPADICFFSAYIWTNCDCSHTKLQILWNDCNEIASDAPTYPTIADKCIDMKQTIEFEGQQLQLYRVEWHNPGIPLGMSANNAWIQIEVQGTGSLQERGIWAFAEQCGTDCNIRFNPGQAICPPAGILDYESVGRDYSFCIATREQPRPPVAAAAPEESCEADYNGDGAATITDMLEFLDVFFEGCDQ